jgi:hypothetical protein
MTIEERELIYQKLESLAPIAVSRNVADKYVAFGLGFGARFRVSVSVSARKGVGLFTEDEAILQRLKSEHNIPSHRSPSNEPRTKYRWYFPDLTVEQITAHEDDFRMLVKESLNIIAYRYRLSAY